MIRLYYFLLPLLCILIFTSAIYSSSLKGAFVYDDLETIVKNPYIKDVKLIPSFFNPHNKETWSVHPRQQQCYRPLLLTSFAFNYSISRLNPLSYHLFNLVLHLINVLLVYNAVQMISYLLDPPTDRKFYKLRGLGFIAALLFACHPIQTEAVSYIVSRSSLLSSFFILCSFIFFLCDIKAEKNTKYLFRSFSLFCFLLGLLTKEIVIVLPLLVFIFYTLVPRTSKIKDLLYGSLKMSLPYLIIVGIYLFIRIYLIGKNILFNIKDIFIPYFFTALKGLFIYLKILFFPVGQTVDHFLPIVESILEPHAILAFLVVVVSIFLLFTKILSYSKALFFYGIWFGIGFLPNVVLPTLEPISEHTVYFPSVGFFGGIGFLIAVLWYRYKDAIIKPIKITLMGLFCLIIIQLGLLTLNRNTVWQNSLTLWNDAVRKAPQKVRPHQNLGNTFCSLGRFDLAMREFEKVISLDPRNAEAFNNMGIVLGKMGNIKKAEKAFNDSITLKPRNPDAHNNLGLLHMLQGRHETAISNFREALSLMPNSAVIHVNLGRAYIHIDKISMGCYHFKIAKGLDPDYRPGIELFSKLCPDSNFLPKVERNDS